MGLFCAAVRRESGSWGHRERGRARDAARVLTMASKVYPRVIDRCLASASWETGGICGARRAGHVQAQVELPSRHHHQDEATLL